MSNLKNTDLMIVGRLGESYSITVTDVAAKINNGNLMPDSTNSAAQSGTLDDRYLNLVGGTLTGSLFLAAAPQDDLEAATKLYVDEAVGSIDILPDMSNVSQQDGTLDTRYVNITGDSMAGDLILNNPIAADADDKTAVRKDYVDAADQALSTALNQNVTALTGQIVGLSGSIAELADDLADEVVRASQAETELGERIDTLELGDLADVNVAGAVDLQVLSYDQDSDTFSPRTIVLSSTLVYRGQVNLTDAGTVPGAPSNGDLFVNTATSGSVNAAFGSTLQSQITSISGGEMIAYDGTEFVFVGNIGGGLTYESFSAANADTAAGNGALEFNNQTGVFTYTPADVESRIPRNLSTLTALPA